MLTHQTSCHCAECGVRVRVSGVRKSLSEINRFSLFWFIFWPLFLKCFAFLL